MLNVPNPAPTIQRWKEVITTINKKPIDTKKFLFYTVSMRSMASYTAGATLFPQQIGIATFNTKKEDQKFQLMKRELPQFHGFFHQI
jgi:beta-glucosidase